jgi:Secretion system C-terminal sorting domain
MKKNYTFLLFISLLLTISLHGQVIYPTTTSVGSIYNAGDANLVAFDDVGFEASLISAKNTVSVKKLTVQIGRAANAPATTVTVWMGILDDLGNIIANNYGSLNLPANGATGVSVPIVLGDGNSVIEDVPITTYTNNDGFFLVGVQFSNPSNLNGWIIYSAPPSPNFNDDFYSEYDVTNKSSFDYDFGVGNPNASFGIEVVGSLIALPVELTSFTGKKTGLDQCTLNWATASEKSNEGYDVEKSSDGERFSKIEFVKGAGNSLIEQKYEYRDNSFSQSAYYRLKQNDSDGKYTYSKVIFIENKNSAKSKTSVYPNPNKGVFTIDHSSETEDVSITNALGQIVYSNKVKDANRSEVDISNLPSGLYQVRLMGKNNLREVHPIQLTGQ